MGEIYKILRDKGIPHYLTRYIQDFIPIDKYDFSNKEFKEAIIWEKVYIQIQSDIKGMIKLFDSGCSCDEEIECIEYLRKYGFEKDNLMMKVEFTDDRMGYNIEWDYRFDYKDKCFNITYSYNSMELYVDDRRYKDFPY